MAKVADVVSALARPIVERAGCTLWDVEYVKEAGALRTPRLRESSARTVGTDLPAPAAFDAGTLICAAAGAWTLTSGQGPPAAPERRTHQPGPYVAGPPASTYSFSVSCCARTSNPRAFITSPSSIAPGDPFPNQ